MYLFSLYLFLKGIIEITTEQVEDLFDSVVYECDKYFPAFQIYLKKKNDPIYAINTALLETLGEA